MGKLKGMEVPSIESELWGSRSVAVVPRTKEPWNEKAKSESVLGQGWLRQGLLAHKAGAERNSGCRLAATRQRKRKAETPKVQQ